MAEGDAGFEAGLVVGLAEAAGVGELEADDEVVGGAVALLVLGDEGFAEPGEAGLVGLVDDELVGVGAAVGPDGHGFAAEDELGAALAEALPAAEDVGGDAAGGGAVPAFHGVDGAAVAEALAVDGDGREGLGQGRGAAGGDGVFAGQLYAERDDVGAEFGDGPEGGDARELGGGGHSLGGSMVSRARDGEGIFRQRTRGGEWQLASSGIRE